MGTPGPASTRITPARPATETGFAAEPTTALQATEPPVKQGTLAGVIKMLFRKAKKPITKREDLAPPSKTKRTSRGGDTGRASFTISPRKIIRHATKLSRHLFARANRTIGPSATVSPRPSESHVATPAFLSDTIDWLNLWHNDATTSNDSCLASGIGMKTNHLSPRL
jgi:hypothetical protein